MDSESNLRLRLGNLGRQTHVVYGDQRPQGGMMLEFLNLAED